MGNYIGLDPVYGQFLKQTLVADDVSTSFTLDYPTSQDESLMISYGGVIQEPGISYTVDGTNVDFTFTPSSAVSPFYIVYLGENMLIPVLSIGGMVSDTLPKLGGDLDLNTYKFTDGTNTVLDFTQNIDAENYLVIENASMGNAPQLRVDGGWSDIDLNITAKGAGIVRVQPELHVGAASTVITENSITTTNFIGEITGNASTATTAETVTTAAQPNITSVGTLTSFTSTGIDDNATAERLQLQDGAIYLGSSTAASNYIVNRPIDDGWMTMLGSTTSASSGGINLYGGTHSVAPSRIDLFQDNIIRFRVSEASAGGDITLRDNAGGTAFTVDGAAGHAYAANGIRIGADAAANLLDDYEEGTFSPTIYDASTGGNQGTPAGVEGRYTKIGRLCHIWMKMNNIDTTGMTAGNDVFFRGLPFVNEAGSTAVGSAFTSQISTSGVAVAWMGTSVQWFRLAEVALTTDYVIVSELTSGAADIYVSMTYEVA